MEETDSTPFSLSSGSKASNSTTYFMMAIWDFRHKKKQQKIIENCASTTEKI